MVGTWGSGRAKTSAENHNWRALYGPLVEKGGMGQALTNATGAPILAQLLLELERSPAGIVGNRVETDRETLPVGETHHERMVMPSWPANAVSERE